MLKNAKFNRNALRGLVAALALGGLQVAHAGYAQLAAPAGFGGSSGAFTYAANAANDKTVGRVVHSAGSLSVNVGGQAVKMSAAYRLAANAPRIAAAAVYLNPGVRTAVAVAGWLIAAKLVWDEAKQQWARLDDQVDKVGYLWQHPFSNDKFSGPLEACKAGWPGAVTDVLKLSYASYGCLSPDGFIGSVNRIETITKGCLDSTALTSGGCIGARVEEPKFVDDLAKVPMPSTVPLELPYPTPLPIEQPSPWINPSPGENPQSQPLRVPTGTPVPIPNTNPQQYRQPYVDIVPAPTPDNPWRVDVKPGETNSTNPNPAENPQPDSQDKPAEEQDKSLCEKHPDILACSKPELDVPDGEIPKITKQITYAEEGGFGGGSCPSDVYASLYGKQTMVYDWTRTCSVVSTYIRPIILLLGAMGALFILIPGRDS